MKLEVKYIFPTSTSSANFYIYELPESLGMRKVLAHGIRMPGRAFSGFSLGYVGPKSNLHPGTEISSIASLTQKLSIECSEC